jgi:hypothetical protein
LRESVLHGPASSGTSVQRTPGQPVDAVTVSKFGPGLKIRVSVVRFRPWPPLPIFEAHGFSGITRGQSVPARGENRPTIGLTDIRSICAPEAGRRGSRSAAGVRAAVAPESPRAARSRGGHGRRHGPGARVPRERGDEALAIDLIASGKIRCPRLRSNIRSRLFQDRFADNAGCERSVLPISILHAWRPWTAGRVAPCPPGACKLRVRRGGPRVEKGRLDHCPKCRPQLFDQPTDEVLSIIDRFMRKQRSYHLTIRCDRPDLAPQGGLPQKVAPVI